jgi:hypothetical protein
MVFPKEEGGYIKIKKNKDGKKLSILKRNRGPTTLYAFSKLLFPSTSIRNFGVYEISTYSIV